MSRQGHIPSGSLRLTSISLCRRCCRCKHRNRYSLPRSCILLSKEAVFLSMTEQCNSRNYYLQYGSDYLYRRSLFHRLSCYRTLIYLPSLSRRRYRYIRQVYFRVCRAYMRIWSLIFCFRSCHMNMCTKSPLPRRPRG